MLLKCGLRNECYQTCGLTHVTKCGLKSVLFFCGLDFVCALSNMRSSNKKCGLNPALPKTCGLKSANISLNKEVKSPPFAQHIFIDLATCHYSLTLTPYRCRSTLSNLPQISPFFKNFLFSGRARKSTFFSWPKNTPFSTPQNSTYIRATDLQTRFLRSTDSVDSSDTLSFAISPKLGEL